MRDDYRFLRVNDSFKCLGQKINLIGVVVELGFLNDSNGRDYSLSARIVDQSHPEPGLAIKFFARTVNAVPRVESLGDIVLLSRVRMVRLDGEMTAMCNKTSTFALLRGNGDEGFQPYQCSPSFPTREKDQSFIADLRRWLVHHKLGEESLNFTLLRDVKDGEHFNLVCKFLYSCWIDEDRLMAFVWDGTDMPTCTVFTKLHDEARSGDKLPLHLPPRDILCEFPRVGSIVRVTLHKDSAELVSLKEGQWVKFLNVLFRVNAGLWRAICTPSSKLRYATEKDKPVLILQRMYYERNSSKLNRMPSWTAYSHSGITGVDDTDAPFLTLMDLLSHGEVTAKFKCVVRVVAAYPWEVTKFRDSDGIYRLVLILEDPTARIRASVYAGGGEKLFGGHPSDEILIQKRNKLLGLHECVDGEEITEMPRNPPWVQCCIMSFYIDKNDAWGSRRFRVFDTWMVD